MQVLECAHAGDDANAPAQIGRLRQKSIQECERQLRLLVQCAQLGAHPRRARGATPCAAQASRLAVVRKRRRRAHQLRLRSRDDVGGPPPVQVLHVRGSAFGWARDVGGALGGGTLGGVTIGWTHGDQVHSQEAQRAADAKVELCCWDGHAPILAPVLIKDPYTAGDRAGREGGAANGRERHSAAIRGGIRRDLAQSGAIWRTHQSVKVT